MARQESGAAQSGGNTFYKILDGSLTIRSNEAQEGYQPYEAMNPQTNETVNYFIKRYDFVSGQLTNLERVDKEESRIHGWNLQMEDEDGKFSIFFKDGSPLTGRLLKSVGAFDLDKELTVRVWKNPDGQQAIVFQQDGASVPQKWNKENLPEPKQRKNGKWDYSAQEDFLFEKATSEVLPLFAERQGQSASAASAGAGSSSTTVTDDQIPF